MKQLLKLLLLLAILISCCVQPTTTPTPTPTPKPTPQAQNESKEFIATKATRKPEIPESYLIKFSFWNGRGDSSSGLYAAEIPRILVPKFEIKFSPVGFIPFPIAGDRLYIIDAFSVSAYMDGELIWKKNLQEFGGYVTSYGVGKNVYVALSKNKPVLIAIEKASGEISWVREVGLPDSRVISVLVDDFVCVGLDYGDPKVSCYSEDGELLWTARFSKNVKGMAYEDDIIVVSSDKLYALDAKTGKRLWEVNERVSIPLYKNGMFLVTQNGYILAFNSEGKLLWKKYVDVVNDESDNPPVAANNQHIFASASFTTRELKILTFDGEEVGSFKLKDEIPGPPVVSEKVVLLPTYSEGYGKIYVLWNGLEKIFEFKQRSETAPKLAVYNGTVYAVFVENGSVLVYGLVDDEIPKLRISANVSEKVKVRAFAEDNKSALHAVILAYSYDSDWHFKEMMLARRYVTEPVGGYGIYEEEFEAEIEAKDFFQFYVLAVDNSNNVAISEVHAYKLSGKT